MEGRNASVAWEYRGREGYTSPGPPQAESSSEDPVKGGDVVALFVGERRVEVAIRQEENLGSGVAKAQLHGEDWKINASPGMKLVAIFSVSIEDETRNERYPYKLGGIEPQPDTLGDIESNVVAWDLNMIKIKIYFSRVT